MCGGLASCPDGWRKRDADGAQGKTGGGTGGGTGDEALAVVLDFGLGERVEIGDDLGPGACAADRGDPVIQRLFEHEGEEAAEHVTADGLVQLVEDWAGREQMFRGPERLLDIPYMLPLII